MQDATVSIQNLTNCYLYVQIYYVLNIVNKAKGAEQYYVT